MKTINILKKTIKSKGGYYFYSRHKRLYNYLPSVDDRLLRVFSTYGLDKKILKDIRELPIIDIGANIGEFSIYLRAYENHIGKIIAFEPDPIEFTVLQKNSLLYDIIPVSKAVSDINGKLNFILLNDDADSRIIWDENNGSKNVVSVDSTTLEKELSRLKINEVGLVKVEAEGYEPEILKGIDFNELNIKIFCRSTVDQRDHLIMNSL